MSDFGHEIKGKLKWVYFFNEDSSMGFNNMIHVMHEYRAK